MPYSTLINPDEARVFRITHIDNVAWLLDNGLHCRSSETVDPHFVSIGLEELIDKRATRRVKIAPKGMLSDYVPFYFTPWSKMLFNINTGYNGVIQRPNEEIVIIGTRLRKLFDSCEHVLFTDGHAYVNKTGYFNDVRELSQIDWCLLQNRDFANDPNDPDKSRRYQAEALVHKHVSVDALAGIVCHNRGRKAEVSALVEERGLDLRVHCKPDWYF